MSERISNPEETKLQFRPRSERVTFEVLRHRLWQINDEQGHTIVNVSGSPVASEGNDFNVAIADADGALAFVGPYITMHMSCLPAIIGNCLRLFGREGIDEGDMYLTNDPWMGAVHQNDACIVNPVHWHGKLVAWTASTIHLVDVGGSLPGSWNPHATDTFQEAPRYRYLRVIRGGKVQPEVVETFLTNSRMPQSVDLDLRAQIAAANVAKDRLFDLFKRYGIETVLNVMQDCLDYSEVLVRRKLMEIPDGQWYAEDYLDHDGREDRVYTVRVTLTKKESELTFDFRATDDQSPGFINSTYAGVEGAAFGAVLPYLCNDIPWNSGAFRPVVVQAREGTIHHARFPAPVSSGGVNAIWSTRNAATLAMAKMLSCSEKHRQNMMAVWAGATLIYNVFGVNQHGQRFGTVLQNSALQGAGARYFADGYDNSGSLGMVRPSSTNVESAEALYPILYLFRKRVMDSGGAGKFRGGVSSATAVTPYDTESLEANLVTSGTDHSCTSGVDGGYPGGGSNAVLKTGTDVWERLRRGHFPGSAEDLSGELHYLPAKHLFDLRYGDVFIGVPHGGGGFADPLTRDPERVRLDVRDGSVSLRGARDMYGVVLDHETLAILWEETRCLRDEIRERRTVNLFLR
ncbi:MAG: hydantoinase B/oxoprolinase family protein [Chloroflexi bacterium]|nr:hydantoinase B/oxoprolinase family protein [Chloroflexota bacterium]